MPSIKWIPAGADRPPLKERLLLMSNDGTIGLSNVEVGFWDGEQFRFTQGKQHLAKLVIWWARLEPALPKERKSSKASTST